MKSISLGPLTLVGELAGAHVHVTVLGAGQPGQRPHCGRITVSAEEWKALSEERQALADLEAVIAEFLPHPNGPNATTPGDPEAWNAAMFNLGKMREERDAARAQAAALSARYAPIASVIHDWDWHAIAREAERLSPLRFAADALAKVADAAEMATAKKEPQRG